MQITRTQLAPTKVELKVVADQAFLDKVKEHVLGDLAKDVNVAGFRKGHAPRAIVEKSVDEAALQSRFLDHAVNDMYAEAATSEKLRPVAQPEVSITKFVPFTTLEMTATVEVVGKITLPDYKKIKVAKKADVATDKDVQAVLDDLRHRDSTKADVERAAKDGDEAVIDFKGLDAKTKEAIEGGAGNDYPLVLGSNTFIPGFEPELVGLKAGDEKTFDLTFPADYGAKELQKKKVSFTVTVKQVREVTLPELDDKFAAKVGPFKTVADLKADVKRQLQAEKDNQAQRAFENEVLATLAEKTKAEIPKSLVDEEINRMEDEERRNLVYRGQTWQEHLKAEGRTEAEHRENLREQAEARVKTGLALGEVAEAEGVSITPAELDERIAQLKRQYTDKQMQAELAKPENRRELGSRLLTEKTIAKLVGYAQS
ncbi:MAG TPA: trigger factor [Candidatus Saccharimonadales bacterium]|nr:trigger factor [Candidatus Saccharimonadales bacterium]